jgi:inhibitor of cysteine peptidase
VVLLLLGACSLIGPSRSRVALIVTPENAGNSIELGSHQLLLVRLPGNSATGYRWALAAAPSDVLQLRGLPAFERDPAGISTVPGPGTEIWTFTAEGKGQRILLFDYSLPWQTDTPPLRQLSFTVTVR